MICISFIYELVTHLHFIVNKTEALTIDTQIKMPISHLSKDQLMWAYLKLVNKVLAH